MWLTDEVERRIGAYLTEIEALGGMVSAIKAGYVQGEIAQSAFAYERDLDEKRKITVGMNVYGDPVETDDHHACYQLDPAVQVEQIRQLGEFKRGRDPVRLTAALAAVREVAGRPEGNENNLIVPIKEAVKSHAIREIVRALKDVFGTGTDGPGRPDPRRSRWPFAAIASRLWAPATTSSPSMSPMPLRVTHRRSSRAARGCRPPRGPRCPASPLRRAGGAFPPSASASSAARP